MQANPSLNKPQVLSSPLQKWRDKGTMVNFNGQSIFVIDEGDRDLPVIMLIHGFPTSSWDFDGIWAELRKRFRLVCLDMLGFGFSDKPNKRNYTIHKQADLFDALIQHCELTQYHILAHDYGVSVAQELLAREQDSNRNSECLSCCFLNGGLFPETHQALLIQKLLLGPLGPLINKLNGFKMFSKSFSSVFGTNSKPSEQELRQFWEVINVNDGSHLFHNLITYINDRREHQQRWREVLQNSPIPLALINGSVDPVSGSHLVLRYKELNCRLDYLAELAETGHYPQTEDPTGVASHYLSFLDQITGNDD